MSQYIDQDDGVTVSRSFVIQADSIKVTDQYGNVAPLAPTGPSAGKRDWAFFGDSRAFLSTTSPGGLNVFQRNVGMTHWIQAYSQGAVNFPASLNFGVAGDSTQQMIARQAAAITAIKAAGCTNVLFIGSTNDQSSGSNVDQGIIRRNLIQIVRSFKQNGINVVVISETPRGTGTSAYELPTQTQKDAHYNMHLWMERTLSKMCTVVNVWERWIDKSTGTNYYPKPGYTADGIHPAKIGAKEVGIVVGPALALITRQLGDILESNSAYNATSNTYGTLTPNPLMTGTTGTYGFTPVAGSQLATGWNATGDNITSSLQFFFSKDIDNDGKEWQKITVTGTAPATGTTLNLENTVALAQLANNDNIKMTNLYRSRGVGLSNVGNQIVIIPQYQVKQDAEDSDNSLPFPAAYSGVLSCESPGLNYLTSQNITQLVPRLSVSFVPNAVVNAEVWFTNAGMLKYTP